MEDEQAADNGENGAAPEPESASAAQQPQPQPADGQREPDLDEVEPELLATFTEIGIVETRRAIEAILLVATDPTPASLLAQLLEVPVEHVELLCHALADSYEEANHGFQLVKVAGGWRYQTHPDMAPYVERFAMDGQSSKLSNAALETLAIVAYKQPISRAQVSAIRGVNVDAVLRTLVQRGYVDEVGRDTGAGQAVLFGTTSMFLERLGINTVADLPALGDFVPSAEVVEALEQTLKVDLDPDLVGAVGGDDPGPARPPTPPEADEPEAEAAAPPQGDEAEAADGQVVEEPAAEAEPSAEPSEVEPELAAEAGGGEQPPAEAADAGTDGESPDSRREIQAPDTEAPEAEAEVAAGESAAVVAGDVVEDEAAPVTAEPGNERAAEQTGASDTTTSEAVVVAPEGVVVDAQASPKSGADRVERPMGPGGQPAGLQAGGGEPELADPASTPVAGAGAGHPADAERPRSGLDGGFADQPDPAGRPAPPDASDRSGSPSGQPDPTARPGHDVGRPAPWARSDRAGGPGPAARAGTGPGHAPAAAGRPDQPVPARHEPESGYAVEVDGPAGASAPAPTLDGRPAPQPDATPAGSGDPVAHPGPRLDGPAGEPGGTAVPAGPDPAGHQPPVGGATAGPRGPGLAGPADTAVPPVAGSGPELTSPPEVDLRPAIDLTDPPAHAPAPGAGTGSVPIEPDRSAGS
ncbi:MAG: SMC-Scp complex subunit ScpB [Acidimicrobiales bacterium]